MNIFGKKISLRAFEEKDMDSLREMVNSPAFEESVVGWSFPISTEDQIKWFNSLKNGASYVKLAIEANETKEFVGFVSLTQIDTKNRNADIGIKLLEKFQGQGYAKDAVNAIIFYAFNELNLHKVYASILSSNAPSIGLFESLGFELEGKRKEQIFKSGRYIDLLEYGFVKEERGC